VESDQLKVTRRTRTLVLWFALATSIAAVASPSRIGIVPASRPRPAPKAVTPFTSFNFGDVYSGEVISQIFVIKNEGDSDLLITDFTPG
jgi:hypothetical protein